MYLIANNYEPAGKKHAEGHADEHSDEQLLAGTLAEVAPSADWPQLEHTPDR